MEKIFTDQDYILKQPNDGRIQIKQLSILEEILHYVQSLEKKPLTQIQSKIEELLFKLILNNRITSDILSRYTSYIYIHIFDKGRNSHLTDLINSFIEILDQKEKNSEKNFENISDNIKCTFMWIIGYVCKKCEYKSPVMGALLELLINICINKVTSDLFINEAIKLISKFLNMNINNTFVNKIPEIYKLISKKEKNIPNKKYLLKCIYGSLFYYENKDLISMNFFHKKYNFIMELIENYFKIHDDKINQLAINTFIFLHDKIIFKDESLKEFIDFEGGKKEKKSKKIELKNYELLNFLHVIYYFSQIDLLKYRTNKSFDNSRRMISHLKIIIHYIEKNKELINLNENVIDDIYELLLNSYNLNYSLSSLLFSDGLDIVNNCNHYTMKTNDKIDEINNMKQIEDEVNQKIILLFRTFIKSIYITTHRMHFLTELFSKLKEVQTYIDKLTEDNTVTLNDLSVLIENGIINKVYTIPQINILLLSLVEISENNPELFELNYNSFQDISNNISFFLTSGIRSFRIFVTNFVSSLSYYLPSYRLSISSLVINVIGALYKEIIKLKNNILYFCDIRNTEYRNSIIIHKNLLLFKDICNCLSMILCTSKHKSKGISINTLYESFKKAKSIILGNDIATLLDTNKLKDPIPYSHSLSDDSNNYLNKNLIAYKESGWIIMQGICTVDKKFVVKEFNNIFFLLKFTFNEKTCELNLENLEKIEFKENLINDFFNKKAAINSLNKLIMLFKNDSENMSLFKEDIMYVLKYVINYFIPRDKNEFINFYKYHLKEAYMEVQKSIYEIFYNLPMEFYTDKFNSLIYSLSDNIMSNNYLNRYLNKNTLDLLDKLDTFMCMEETNVDNSIYPNQYFIDNYYMPSMSKNMISNENDLIYNFYSCKTFNFLYTAMNLLIKIFSHEKLTMKNKNAIIKFFLNSLTVIVVKGINMRAIYEKTKDYEENIGNYNKLINIIICVLLLIKYLKKYKINLMEDLELFTSIKMIFDLCYKIDEFGILNIIACEGISHLINLYNKKEETLEHYFNLCEIKFNHEKSKPKINDFIYSFYLLSSIFKNVDYAHIKPFIDKYMNFIISYFNPNDLVANNPYISQSLYSLGNTLIKENELDMVKKIEKIFEMNIIYINGSNKHFIKSKFLYESINELKLLMLFCKRYKSLTENEKNLMKCILCKFIHDDLYKYKPLVKYFLLLLNEIVNQKIVNEFSEYIFEFDLLEFLFEEKNNFTNNLLSLYLINNLIVNNYKQIESITNKNINKDINKDTEGKENTNNKISINNISYSYIKNKVSIFVKKINELYHSNKNIFYLNKIYKNFFDNNHHEDYNNNDLNSTLDINNNFDKKFNNYHLIMMYKRIIINYISYNYKNIDESINFLKIILQKKINLYKNGIGGVKRGGATAEGGDESLKDNQENLGINQSKILFNINNLNFILHINLQKFLIKQISKSLFKYVDEIVTIKTTNHNKNAIEKSKLDILGKLMNTSMILIQCEESWEIKYLGIKLLHKLVIKYSNIKDFRSDDDSLLIQQYEIQISSCIKNIFISKSKSPVTFKSISKGFNLIYLFLTVSVSSDVEFIKKFDEYIHFLDFLKDNKNNNTIKNNNFNYCSEKEENIVNCRFFILLCKLFISSFTKSNFNISYICKNKIEKKIEFYSSNMSEEIKNELKNKFIDNCKNFGDNMKYTIYKMYKNLLNKNEDKNTIDNNVDYSNKYWLKYSSVFLTTISILLHNNELKNYETIFDTEFIQFLFELIFYLIKKINTYKNSKNAIFYIIDIFSSLISNKLFKLNNGIYLLCINEFNNLIKIDEFKDNKNLLTSFQKFSDKLLSDENKDNLILIKKVSELIKLFKEKNSSFNSTFITIYNSFILKLIKLYKEESNNNEELKFVDEFKYYVNLIFDAYYNNNDNNISKILLEKLFTILLNISDEKKDLFILYIEFLINTLIKISENFQKFYTLFYIVIQYISKSSNIELIKELKNNYIKEALNTKNKLYDSTNKSFLLSVTQLNNPNLIQFINEYLEAIFNSNNIPNNFSQEIQKIIILYIQNEKNDKLRQNIIKLLIKYLNENKECMPIKNAVTFVLGIVKINGSDNNLINDNEVKKLYNEEFEKIMNEINGNNKENKNESEEKNDGNNKKEDNKDNNNEDVDEDDFDEVEG